MGQDFRELQIPVGHRLRLVRLVQKFKVCHMIATKNEKMWEAPEWYYCPCCVVFKTRYTLSRTALTIYKAECCKKNYDRVDVSSFTDINQQTLCCYGLITIHTTDKVGIINIRTSRDETSNVFKAIQQVWELDQKVMAGKI